jgi:hypothetical protein
MGPCFHQNSCRFWAILSRVFVCVLRRPVNPVCHLHCVLHSNTAAWAREGTLPKSPHPTERHFIRGLAGNALDLRETQLLGRARQSLAQPRLQTSGLLYVGATALNQNRQHDHKQNARYDSNYHC